MEEDVANYFKKSYIMEGINLYLIRFILSFFRSRFIPKGKVLIKSCDGIGDILVRTKLVEKIIQKYGEENIYFLMQKGYVGIGDILGYKSIGFSREDRKSFFKRLKKMYELNTMGFSTYINLEFTNDITSGNLFIPERIGRIDTNWQVSRNNKYYTKSYFLEDGYVLDQVRKMAEYILGEKISKEEILPDLRDRFSVAKEDIVVAVGSTGRDKVSSPSIMCEYLNVVLERYPDKKIKLVGNGARQNAYAEKLKSMLSDDRVENLVDRTTLKEVFEIVSTSYLFIGFESGLYNLCFSLRKNGIILFKEESGAFLHKEHWLNLIYPKEIRQDIVDPEYPGLGINSISIQDFKNALDFKG